MKETKKHIGLIEAQLAHWDTKIDEFMTAAEDAKGSVRVECDRCLAELKEKHLVAKGKFAEFKVASSEEWDALKGSIEMALNELEDAYKKLTSKNR